MVNTKARLGSRLLTHCRKTIKVIRNHPKTDNCPRFIVGTSYGGFSEKIIKMFRNKGSMYIMIAVAMFGDIVKLISISIKGNIS